MTDLTPEQISGLRGIFTHWLETLDEEHSVEAPLYEGAIKALDMARECLRLRKELEASPTFARDTLTAAYMLGSINARSRDGANSPLDIRTNCYTCILNNGSRVEGEMVNCSRDKMCKEWPVRPVDALLEDCVYWTPEEVTC